MSTLAGDPPVNAPLTFGGMRFDLTCVSMGNPHAVAYVSDDFFKTGPGDLVGDNPLSLADSGGVGAVWIRSRAGQPGRIELKATHSTVGSKSISIGTQGGA